LIIHTEIKFGDIKHKIRYLILKSMTGLRLRAKLPVFPLTF